MNEPNVDIYALIDEVERTGAATLQELIRQRGLLNVKIAKLERFLNLSKATQVKRTNRKPGEADQSIIEYFKNNSKPLTCSEITKGTGIVHSLAHNILQKFTRQGLITRDGLKYSLASTQKEI